VRAFPSFAPGLPRHSVAARRLISWVSVCLWHRWNASSEAEYTVDASEVHASAAELPDPGHTAAASAISTVATPKAFQLARQRGTARATVSELGNGVPYQLTVSASNNAGTVRAVSASTWRPTDLKARYRRAKLQRENTTKAVAELRRKIALDLGPGERCFDLLDRCCECDDQNNRAFSGVL
jgi:hypothetical protein